MHKITALAGALAALAGPAAAGGIDRSGQPVGILFERGNYVELSYGRIMPSVEGRDLTPAETASGKVAGHHDLPGLALKYDLTDRLSAALVYDHAWGADISYPDFTGWAGPGSYMLGGTYAQVESQGLTALLRYRLTDRLSLHGGLRGTEAAGDVRLSGAAYSTVSGYEAHLDKDWGSGFVLGGAYEIPDIALRVALTYFSKVSHSFATQEVIPAAYQGLYGATVDTTTDVDTPQAVNLDFQTGIMANTLLFASARWVDWSDFKIAPQAFFGPNLGSLTNLDDTFTYTLGLGRKFSDTWSGSVFATWEPGTGTLVSPLAPTDGYQGLGLAAVYTRDNMKITTGIRYLWLGDSTPETGTPDVARADFSGNSGLALGIRVGFSF